MRKYSFVVLLLTFVVTTTAQTVYSTAASGNWSNKNTWAGGVIPPSDCNCIIRVEAGHNLRLNSDLTYNNVQIVLVGANSNIEMGNGSDITLTGTTSIDLHTASKIYHTGSSASSSFIIMSGVTIYKGDSVMQSTSLAGVVAGPAHASSDQAASGFVIGALPVVLVEFRVATSAKSIALVWKTSQEYKSDKFVIERSNDGKTWTNIAEVKSAGFSSSPQSYTYTDLNPAKGMNYYRLQMVDMDGRFAYTPVRIGRMTAFKSPFSVYPNPAVNTINVFVERGNTLSGDLTVNIFNRLGQLVVKKVLEANSDVVSFNVGSYAPGDYMVEISGKDGFRQSSKFIIARK